MNASNQTRIRPTPYLNLCSQPTSGARCPKSSLTPGRKHHKLLKDGSGVEVWPESIERIFVDGLQAYASCAISHNNHPSTFSEAGASSRSRLRNAYLVQYLASHGIDRSRKQVASHLQVLKNMWKAEGNSDNYHLVGLEHLPPPQPQPSSDILSPTEQHRLSRNPSPAFSCTSSASSSSSILSPSSMTVLSPGEWSIPVVPSPHPSPPLAHSIPQSLEQSMGPRANLSMATAINFSQRPTRDMTHRPEPQDLQVEQQRQTNLPAGNHALTHGSSSLQYALVEQNHPVPSVPPTASLWEAAPSRSRVNSRTPIPSKLLLRADGMTPAVINLEKYMYDNTGTPYLRLQLDVPMPQPSSLLSRRALGFAAELEVHHLSPASPHQGLPTCKCTTQVWGVGLGQMYASSAASDAHPRLKHRRKILDQLPLSCFSKEESDIDITNVLGDTSSRQGVWLTFPPSALSTCQWLEAGATRIDQELSVGGKVMFRVTYMLSRQKAFPAAKLLRRESLSISSQTSPSNLSLLTHHSLIGADYTRKQTREMSPIPVHHLSTEHIHHRLSQPQSGCGPYDFPLPGP